MSIRLRLTLWNTALLGLALLLFAVILYSALQNALVADVNETTRSQAEKGVGVIEKEIDPMAALQANRLPLIPTVVFASQTYAQVVTPDGRVVHRSNNLLDMNELLPISRDMLDLNVRGESGSYTLYQRGTPIHVYSMPIHRADGTVVGALQVGQSLAEVDNTLARVRLALLIGSSLALLAAAAGAAFLARTTLRPVDEITRTARRIGRTEHLAERIAIADTGDEVSRLAETFNEMLERLDHLFQTQQRLIGDVSHELRTPLTTMQGNLDLLKRGAIEDPALRAEALHEIETEVGRMSRMIGDLLLLAQADAGLNLQRVPVELDTLLLDVFRHGRLIAQDRVEVRLGHEDQAQVLGDPDRLRQLLVNLVENAIKYTPDGGTIMLSLDRAGTGVPQALLAGTNGAGEPSVTPEDWIRIEVHDSGIGIAAEDLPHVFERFFRADRARSRRLGGSGLGLSIAQWVAQVHGGDITVQSAPGEGSTFTLWLPLYTPRPPGPVGVDLTTPDALPRGLMDDSPPGSLLGNGTPGRASPVIQARSRRRG